MGINLYSENDFIEIRKSGRLVAEVLDYVGDFIKPGITTKELDDLCHNFIIKKGGIPACLNYKGYPKSSCISINEVVCHGIPNKYKLQPGDILNIDIVVKLGHFHGDASRMYFVPPIDSEAKKLIDITYNALHLGISKVKLGGNTSDIGKVIQHYVEAQGFAVVRDYCGHGIGRSMHEEPNILHYDAQENGVNFAKGMVFTIEPMVNVGTWRVKLDTRDNWTVRTGDGKLSAQWEHTLGINHKGECEIFTLSNKSVTAPFD